jgi:hypothetical protein
MAFYPTVTQDVVFDPDPKLSIGWHKISITSLDTHTFGVDMQHNTSITSWLTPAPVVPILQRQHLPI